MTTKSKWLWERTYFHQLIALSKIVLSFISMEAALKRRISRAPPPTPIANGKGLRSAAVDDSVLSQYLESSLRVPELALPRSRSFKSPIGKTLATVNLSSLRAGDDGSVREVVAAVRELGAFSIDVGDFLGREEVRVLIAAGREAIGSEGEMVVGEETEDGAYWIFREKAEKITCKLEMVAETIAKILSQYVKIQSHSAKVQKMHSVISLRKYDNSNQLSGYATKHYDSTLSLHITGDDHKFRIRSPDSNCSTLPTGIILFTVGKHFEEISDGELKCFNGEIFVDPSDDSLTPLSLEFMYTLPVLNHVPSHSSSKAVSIMDQLLALLVLVFLYNLCS